MNDTHKSLFVECDCFSPDHVFKFSWFEDEPEVYLITHLRSHKGFFLRLKYVIKYLFGYKCRYGAWDEVILNKNKIKEISEFLAQQYERIEKLENK